MQVLCRNDVYEFYNALDQFWLGSADTNFVPRQDYVDFLHQQPRVIANLSTEHWGDSDYPMCQYMHDVMVSHPNFVILSHNPDHDQLKPNILFFPFWLGYTKNKLITTSELPAETERSKYIGCVNYRARPHRVRMCRLLVETNLHVSSHLVLPFGNPNLPLADADDARFWKSLGPATADREFDLFDTNWSPYQDSWLNVITETSAEDGIFITEKTWKCIAVGQLFVLLSGRGSIAHLRDLGFDTFDDIIPHHRYDHLTGYAARCDAIIEVLKSLQNLNWFSIYKTTHQRRLRNQQLFLDGSAYHPYIKRIEKSLNL
jgi:hypothetical protein